MKYPVVFLSFVGLAMAQRPTYAGASPKGYPELASRFRDPAEDQNATQMDSSVSVANRIGEGDEQTQNIPVDARGDVNLVNRLNQWPRDNRPFWLLNAHHIDNLRHPERASNTQTNQVNQEVKFKNQQRQQTNENRQVFVSQSNGGEKTRVQSRFGESLDTETRTIRPNIQRGSFAGSDS